MRIAITTVQVPFIRGGAESLAEELVRVLRQAGHEAEIVSVPFKWYPADCLVDMMAIWRSIDLTSSNGVSIDRIITLKFPSYLAHHPNQVMWLLHQHRDAYDAWDHPHCALAADPRGGAVRELVMQADRQFIPRLQGFYTISRNVSQRLSDYCGISSMPLYHPPPHAERIRQGDYGDYLLVPGRINESKRQSFVLDALRVTRTDVRLVFMGHPDNPDYGETLRQRAAPHGDRVRWLGRVSEDDRLTLYAGARGVVFPPIDEDYGYVALEAMLAAKPVITCSDSGGPLEFIEHKVTGFVCPPDVEAMADALDQLWTQRDSFIRWGKAAYDRYHDMRINWDNVLSCLLA